MSTIDIFPVKIYKVKYTGDIESLKKSVLPKLTEVYNKTTEFNQGSMRGDGLCSYNVMRDLNAWPEFQALVKFVNDHAWQYWQELGYDSKQRPEVYEMWSNIYKHNSFIEAHNHAPIHLTSSFYLQMPACGGNITFEHPNSTLMKHQPFDLDGIRYGNTFEHEITVETGDLIFFPGWLVHKTKPNMSTDDKIIIGSNICNVV
jgi:uncharacterized protein (TIGR02466 family)